MIEVLNIGTGNCIISTSDRGLLIFDAGSLQAASNPNDQQVTYANEYIATAIYNTYRGINNHWLFFISHSDGDHLNLIPELFRQIYNGGGTGHIYYGEGTNVNQFIIDNGFTRYSTAINPNFDLALNMTGTHTVTVMNREFSASEDPNDQ
jgi:hypothetical protein